MSESQENLDVASSANEGQNSQKISIKEKNLVISNLKDLVSALECFKPKNKGVTPYNFYQRLLSKVDLSKDENSGDSFLKGLVQFFKTHEKLLENMKEFKKLPKKETIKFISDKGVSDRVYLEIQKFVHLSTEENKDVIRKYLLVMKNIIEKHYDEFTVSISGSGSSKKMLNKMGLDPNTPEGQFISNIAQKTTDKVGNLGNVSDPMQAITQLFMGGGITEMVNGIKDGVEGKGGSQLNLGKLLKGMQNAVGGMADDFEEDTGKQLNIPDGKKVVENMNSELSNRDDSDDDLEPPEHLRKSKKPLKTGDVVNISEDGQVI